MLTKIAFKPENFTNFKSFLFFIFIVLGINFNVIFCYHDYDLKCNDSWKKISLILKFIGFFSIWYMINSICVASINNYTNFKALVYFIFIVIGSNIETIICSDIQCNDSWKRIFWIIKIISLTMIWTVIDSIYKDLKKK